MQALLHAVLTRLIRVGHFTVRFPNGRIASYGPDAAPPPVSPSPTGATARRLLTNPALEFGEAYVDGRLQTAGLHAVPVDGFAVRQPLRRRPAPGPGVRAPWRACIAACSAPIPCPAPAARGASLRSERPPLQPVPGSRPPISCGYFENGDETLEEAQAAKKRNIAPSCCWIAPISKCSISAAAGAAWPSPCTGIRRPRHRHHALGGTTRRSRSPRRRSRAVGPDNHQTAGLPGAGRSLRPHRLRRHVRTCRPQPLRRVLRHDPQSAGARRRALIHAIGRADGPSVTNPWLERNIFPGGYSPALSEVFAAVEKSRMIATDIEILRLHYAETLRHWRRRFAANRDNHCLALRRTLLPHVRSISHRRRNDLPPLRPHGLAIADRPPA